MNRDWETAERLVRAALRNATTPEGARRDIVAALPHAEVQHLEVEMGAGHRTARMLVRTSCGTPPVQARVQVPSWEITRGD